MTRSSVVLTLVSVILLACCGGESTTPALPDASVDLASAQPGDVLRLDDQPLYFMRSNVDYGFDAYRRVTAAVRRPGHRATPSLRPGLPSWACTCFATAATGSGPLFGRNFDWSHRASLLLYTTPPNAHASLSMVDLHYVDFADDVSLEELRGQRDRVAQRAPYVPFDGVNEEGVAIGLMAVPTAQAPFDPTRASLYDLALIRLVLDYADDANHAVELLRSCNYRVTSPPVHFLIADRTGRSALVEYVEGEMKVVRSSEPFAVATNFVVFGSQAPLSTGCPRYARAHSTLLAKGGVLSRAEALDLLSAVSQPSTMWSAVYDLNARGIEVAPGRRYGRSYRFAMSPAR